MSENNIEKEVAVISKNVQSAAEIIKSLSLDDVASLVSHLEKHFGVSAQNFSSGGVSGASGSSEEDKGPSFFDVVIKDAGASKIKVIKEVRSITGLGLVEAKNLVSSGGVVKSSLTKEDAEELEKKLKECGAIIALEPSA